MNVFAVLPFLCHKYIQDGNWRKQICLNGTVCIWKKKKCGTGLSGYKTVVFSGAVFNCTKALPVSRQRQVTTKILVSGFVGYQRQITRWYELRNRVLISSFPQSSWFGLNERVMQPSFHLWFEICRGKHVKWLASSPYYYFFFKLERMIES